MATPPSSTRAQVRLLGGRCLSPLKLGGLTLASTHSRALLGPCAYSALLSWNVPPCKDCAASNEIKAREPIRCRECGCRVMYKKRIKRSECTPIVVQALELSC